MIFKKAIPVLVLLLSALTVKASDTLVVIFDRQQFVQGDTVNIEVYTENYKTGQPAQTLHLWIDDKNTGRRWKYRYPYLKGRHKIALKISDSIPAGAFAFNFLLQEQFLTIKGKIVNAAKQDTSINFVAKSSKKVPIIDGVQVQKAGDFKIDQLFYTDTVLFSFSRSTTKKENPLKIIIETPVDSTFVPAAMVTEFISVGKTDNAETRSYAFDINDPNDPQLLKGITLQTKAKKPIDEYIQRNVSGLFGGGDARTLDLLSSDDALTYSDLFTYLIFKFPGLVQKTNSLNGQPYLTYRNETVDMYVDEYLDTDFNVSTIQLQDIAMIRFFGQSFRLGGGLNDDGFGGSIVIYTKKPEDKRNKLGNYTFYIKGYTPRIAEWK